MMIDVGAVIEWISTCIEREQQGGPPTLSLWNELYSYGQLDENMNHKLPALPDGAAPLVVYVTGVLDEIRQRKGPFYHMQEPEDLIFMVYGEGDKSLGGHGSIMKCSSPLLRYVTICFVPFRVIKFYQSEIDRFVVFTHGKPEKWMHSLFLKKKVAGLVGWQHMIDDNWHVNWSVSYDDFTYGLFLDVADVQEAGKTEALMPQYPNTPVGLKLGLQRALKEGNSKLREQLWKQTIDRAAMQMLDEYWLLNHIEIKEFVPELMEKVRDYLYQIRSIPPQESNINRVGEFLKWWLQK
ncbi:hypothetical protein ACNQFZ_19975 [Schinkia sp. CFF1]